MVAQVGATLPNFPQGTANPSARRARRGWGPQPSRSPPEPHRGGCGKGERKESCCLRWHKEEETQLAFPFLLHARQG